ncbi:SusC/RagA family TonB-linked outer membrane protein [Parachryseolinea silvisoli]|uniref:SusC/RagA family TonB-linked outer membrane protein n=1 Tax=Parachryseolinea silvisoli TaxID=2873601 RepID=UPI002265F873|nr:TonB-dependent receptor [Parachryseolinea silvisoli]MCD9017150.1 TonB-dependent receptor [Parachryseolinea silvisoli]
MNLKLLLFLLFFGLLSGKTLAQEFTLSGTITDQSSSDPLPGVNVIVKGTSKGTTTDMNGAYSVQVSSSDVLVFSFIGYAPIEMAVGNQTAISVALVPDITQLNEIVVVGYTTQKKGEITGAVAVVDVDRVAKAPYSNVLQSMVGSVSGVSIAQDGQPGKGRTDIKIRGITTLNNNQPLYVVDGVPTIEDLSNLNPNDIESIQVLKDASAASIYGSRSAGGVVVVTTKKGKKGKLTIDAGAQVGVQTLAYKINLLDATQWGQLYWRASRNSNIAPSNPLYGNGLEPVISTEPFLISNGRQTYQFSKTGTDWYKEVYHPAATRQYYANVSNGTEKGNVFLGFSYYNQDGLIKKTFYDRYTARLNSDYNLTPWLRAGENLSVAYSDQVQIASQQGQDGIPLDVIRQHPLLPVYDVNGKYAGKIAGLPDVRNMVSVLDKNKDNTTNTWRIFGNAFLEADLFGAIPDFNKDHSLKLKSSFGLDYSNFYDRRFSAKYQEGDYDIQQNNLANNYGAGITTTWTNTVEYNFNRDPHSLKVLGGMEAVQYTFHSLSGTRTGFEVEDPSFTYLKAGSGVQTNTGDGTEWGLLSYFGRADYAYKGKYLVSGTLRYDQTSRLNTSGVFPAGSVGWVLTEEDFLQGLTSGGDGNILSSAKIRAGYGKQGNQQIGDFATRSIFGADQDHTNYDLDGTNTSALQGYRVYQRGNPDLKWESTTQYNIGTDLGLLHNRLQVVFDYYVKTTDDILMRAPQITALGEGDAPYINAASMRNKGIDLSIAYHHDRSPDKISFGAQLQFSKFSNEVLDLGPGIGNVGYENERYLNGGDGPTRITVGKPMGVFYGYVVEGIFQNQSDLDAHATQNGKDIGRLKYKDVNTDGEINDKDRTYLGSPYPDFNMGLNLTAGYKGISLSMFFYSAVGQKVYNEMKWYTDFAQSGNFNHGTRILNAWTPDNTSSSIPAPVLTNDNNENRASSYYVENASYLKLRNVRLAYDLPSKLVAGFRINVYGEVQNVFRITNYKGLDPEVTYAANSNFVGIDRGVYPLPRMFMLGLTIRN